MDKSIIDTLSLAEKTLLVSGEGHWHTHAVGCVPSLTLCDGPNGLRKQTDGASINDSEIATCFPTACAVATSWNIENAGKIASAIADEAIEKGVDVVLGPGVNIKRSPLCGRNFEYFSEDPLLTGRLANAFVDSMQGRGIGCSLKHFAVNSQEKRRMTVDAIVDERALREIYLSAFEYVVKNSKPYTVMASYNKINGEYATENARLLDILRNEWGFNGVVVSDWGACYNPPKSLERGMDLEMPDGGHYHRKTVLKALESGNLAIEKLDQACVHVAELAEKCVTHDKHCETDLETRRKICLEVARDSAVLLKNSGVLPLAVKSDFCVIGELAEKPRFQGSGSSHINARCKSFLEVLQDNGIKAEYAKGYGSSDDKTSRNLEKQALNVAVNHKTVLFFGGLTDRFEGEGNDRTNLDLPSAQTSLLRKISQINDNIVFVGFGGSPFETGSWLGKVQALLHMYLGGQEVMQAVFDLLFGKVSPSGRLAETYPIKLSDTPCYNYFANDRYFDEHRESIFVGYRYYDTFCVPVAFPFGYGLSYGKFRYDELKVVPLKDGFNLSVKLTNCGNCAASEVVQIYVDNCVGSMIRANRELRAFSKVYLQVGESATVKFLLNKRDFSVYVADKGFVAVNGEYGISVCKNVQETLLSQKVYVDFGESLDVDESEYLDYFVKKSTSFTVSDEQFYLLTNWYKPKIELPLRGEYTMLNTLEDMAPKVWLVRTLLRFVRRMAIKQSPTKNIADPVAQMVLNGAKETPLISMMSIGGVPAKYVKFLFYHANKKHGKAFLALFGKYKID
ncbi:MAG: glycoside hydrolase family 3 C-terminal domain-containing protein [Corallococcus sp.]|nr:glycoside hydrolase family 3 C-terminal domain-containing protein [Corallococcus sp.]MCM1359241.1 glycoside hydrolase family 3 C-terminal domain-containing protein [Corallococcus sp.]MCM1394632.1 glycoside hydrolase family 3 C-terminal domain-containing protein [Corallococcus sp.]